MQNKLSTTFTKIERAVKKSSRVKCRVCLAPPSGEIVECSECKHSFDKSKRFEVRELDFCNMHCVRQYRMRTDVEEVHRKSRHMVVFKSGGF